MQIKSRQTKGQVTMFFLVMLVAITAMFLVLIKAELKTYTKFHLKTVQDITTLKNYGIKKDIDLLSLTNIVYKVNITSGT